MIYYVLASLLEGVVYFLYLYSWLIVLAGALNLFTRVKDKPGKMKVLLKRLTDPVNDVFRRLLAKLSGRRIPIDVSPILSLIFIWVLSGLMSQLSEYFLSLAY